MMERIVEMAPAFDRRDPDPSKNYGIHGVDLRMILKGPKGAVQFVVYTNWHLPHVRREQDAKTQAGDNGRIALSCRYHPLPADVGYHSPHPMYDDQPSMSSECEYVDGPCYYDGSATRAETWFNEILLPKGSDGIWEALEEEYARLFDKAEAGPVSDQGSSPAGATGVGGRPPVEATE